jgi:hypothetical protein
VEAARADDFVPAALIAAAGGCVPLGGEAAVTPTRREKKSHKKMFAKAVDRRRRISLIYKNETRANHGGAPEAV